MGLLDLPLLVFQFPPEPETDSPCLILTINVTGDIRLEFSDGFFQSKTAATEFISFCEKLNQKELAKLFGALIVDAKQITPLLFKGKDYQISLEKAFPFTRFVLKTEGIREFFEALKAGLDKPFKPFPKKITLSNILLLDVSSKLLASHQPLITTQMDWKGDFSLVICRQTMGLRDVFECHMRAVELALAIKTMIQEFWVDLFKRVIVFI